MKMYEVGGCVRDRLLGLQSKDIDFSVVLDKEDLVNEFEDPFIAMKSNLIAIGFKIFLETPEFLTIRARFPEGHKYEKTTADFVLARKEGEYADGRRPDLVTPGSLMDDLRRRDFTMNAIAMDEEQNFIDPFNGREDIHRRIIRAVDDPMERLEEDALRAVRAVRFSVTKGFQIQRDLGTALEFKPVLDSLRENISDERIQMELSKMFRFNTLRSLRVFDMYPKLRDATFSGKVSLDATMKQRGRG